ncbi:MAG: formate dehydrogenase accessory sulfurtransferase FdhD [Microvirga sp.]
MPTASDAGTRVIAADGTSTDGQRCLPTEVPINFVYGGIPFAVMMASPADIEDFAYGFSLTEGIIGHPDEIRGMRIEAVERGWLCSMDLTAERLHDHLARKRAMAGRTGCGLCGIDDLASLPASPAPALPGPEVRAAAIRHALAALEREQPLNDRTRAVHAAAWARFDGQVDCVREDVGRHNALDKLIGSLARRGTDPAEGFVIVTSRCSFELVEKTAAFGARILVALSAPTAFALERAQALDMVLVAIARHDTMTVFHGSERIDASGTLP